MFARTKLSLTDAVKFFNADDNVIKTHHTVIQPFN